MPKKIVAAMRIKHNGEVMEIDSVIDPTKFTEEELTRLYQRGAVKIVLPETPKAATQEDLDDVKAQAAKDAKEKAEADAKSKAEAEAKAKADAAKVSTPTTSAKPANGGSK